MDRTKVVVVDTETSRMDPAHESFFPTEVAALALDSDEMFRSYVRCDAAHDLDDEMPPDVVGVTGITTRLLAAEGKPEVEVLTGLLELVGEDTVLCGHKVDFDVAALEVLVSEATGGAAPSWLSWLPRMDTLRLCRELYPEGWDGYGGGMLPNFRLATCYYGIVPQDRWDPGLARSAHGAMADATMCREVARILIDNKGVDWCVETSAEPFVPRTCPMGDARGKPWEEVSQGLLEWMLRRRVWEFNDDDGLELAVLQEAERRKMI